MEDLIFFINLVAGAIFSCNRQNLYEEDHFYQLILICRAAPVNATGHAYYIHKNDFCHQAEIGNKRKNNNLSWPPNFYRFFQRCRLQCPIICTCWTPPNNSSSLNHGQEGEEEQGHLGCCHHLVHLVYSPSAGVLGLMFACLAR